MSIGFERPLFVFLGFIFIILITLLSRFSKDALVLRFPLGPPGGIPFKPPHRVEFLIRIGHFLELIGAFSLFIALAGPMFISSEIVWLNRGADILFVMDISPSMAGIDMNGRSRFDLARTLVRDFAEDRPSDAIGLVAVGTEAGLLVPPTVDRGALFSRLETLRIAELGDGTALGMGLAIAALHLRNSAAPRRAAVLLTDGENNTGAVHPETAAAVLHSVGVSLWVIGVGSSGEIPIDYVDPLTRIRRTGTFDSRFDPEALRASAGSGGGVYIAAPSAETLSAAFSRVNEAEMIPGRSGLMNRTSGFQGPFIVAGLILFCAVRFFRRYILGAFL
jgi:Ca-activated chloride channel family protein